MRCEIFWEGTGLEVPELALGKRMFGQAWGNGATPDEVSRIIAGSALQQVDLEETKKAKYDRPRHSHSQ
jgi:hypothetical protein